FHTPRPSNRAIRVALEGIQQVSSACIPFILVSGNHETPRIRSTGSIFEAVALFPNVYAAYRSRLETFVVKDVEFTCLPHCSTQEELELALKELQGLGEALRPRILVTHGAWSRSEYGMGEFNEQRLPDLEETAGVRFNYVALGHYHRPVEIRPNVCYSGSTERTSFNEHANACGYLVVDLTTGERQRYEIRTRPMLKLPILDCSGKSVADIIQDVAVSASTVPEGAMVQLCLDNVEPDAFLKLDMRQIDDLFRRALYLEKQLFRRIDERQNVQSGTSMIRPLPIEFAAFLESLPDNSYSKEKLLQLGIRYLSME
ncbi:MAG: hypothetical protein ONA69_03030, partial [candidate division KSB1 bacterium]|nr:hypothetical protein [candidate division KSB1 bacterium]